MLKPINLKQQTTDSTLLCPDLGPVVTRGLWVADKIQKQPLIASV